MADKKEGTLMPKVLKKAIKRSKKESLYKAASTPNKMPNNKAIPIALTAKMAVLGKVSWRTSTTGLPFF